MYSISCTLDQRSSCSLVCTGWNTSWIHDVEQHDDACFSGLPTEMRWYNLHNVSNSPSTKISWRAIIRIHSGDFEITLWQPTCGQVHPTRFAVQLSFIIQIEGHILQISLFSMRNSQAIVGACGMAFAVYPSFRTNTIRIFFVCIKDHERIE